MLENAFQGYPTFGQQTTYTRLHKNLALSKEMISKWICQHLILLVSPQCKKLLSPLTFISLSFFIELSSLVDGRDLTGLSESHGNEDATFAL